MFRFASPQMFYLLLFIPVLVGLYIAAMRAKRGRIKKFGNPQVLAQLMPDASPGRARNKFVIYLCALLLIVIALARPQVGSKFKETTKEGIEIIMAVDVSNSMLAQDLEPNRLESTKFAISRMLDGLHQDQVGLVVFAGRAYIQLPVTSDYTVARNFANQISTDMLSEQGTNIGAAIDLAATSFSSQSEGSRVIILITDGEDHSSDAMAAAGRAAQSGIKIYAIGVGTPKGAPLYIGDDYIRDENGEMVVSMLDEEGLKQLALSTGGGYVRADKQSMGLSEMVSKIKQTQTTTFKAAVFDEYNEQFQYPLALALLLLVVDLLIVNRRSKLLSRLDIFKKGKEQP